MMILSILLPLLMISAVTLGCIC